MAVEEIGRLRTIAIVGQGGAGKTQLAEAMLFTAGATNRLGRPDDGTALMDFEPEEISRAHLDQLLVPSSELEKAEVIVANTPGYTAFLPDAFNTMHAVDAVIFVATPAATSRSSPRKFGDRSSELGLPRIAFVLAARPGAHQFRRRDDRPRKDSRSAAGRADAADRRRGGFQRRDRRAGDEGADLCRRHRQGEGRRVGRRAAKQRAEEARTKLCEAVAETDDALLEKYLERATLEDDELRAALRAGVLAGKLTPVLCGSGIKNIGTGPLLDAIVTLLPAPNERPPVTRPRGQQRRDQSSARPIPTRRSAPSCSRP